MCSRWAAREPRASRGLIGFYTVLEDLIRFNSELRKRSWCEQGFYRDLKLFFRGFNRAARYSSASSWKDFAFPQVMVLGSRPHHGFEVEGL